MVINLEANTVITYLACIFFLFIIGKFFAIPLKLILKIIFNSILGGILIFIINLIGRHLEFSYWTQHSYSSNCWNFRIARSSTINFFDPLGTFTFGS